MELAPRATGKSEVRHVRKRAPALARRPACEPPPVVCQRAASPLASPPCCRRLAMSPLVVVVVVVSGVRFCRWSRFGSKGKSEFELLSDESPDEIRRKMEAKTNLADTREYGD